MTKLTLSYVQARGKPIVILFTDIVGSTVATRMLGDHVFDQIKEQHFKTLDSLISRFHCAKIKVLGDGALIIFENSLDATCFAWLACTDPGSTRIQIRAGLHRSDVNIVDNDISGGGVNYASRVTAALDLNGVIISETVYADLIRELGEEEASSFVQPHAAELKGFGTCQLWHVINVPQAYLKEKHIPRHSYSLVVNYNKPMERIISRFRQISIELDTDARGRLLISIARIDDLIDKEQRYGTNTDRRGEIWQIIDSMNDYCKTITSIDVLGESNGSR